MDGNLVPPLFYVRNMFFLGAGHWPASAASGLSRFWVCPSSLDVLDADQFQSGGRGHADAMYRHYWRFALRQIWTIALVVAAICALGSPARAVTTAECRSQYTTEFKAKGHVGMSWIEYQSKRCGIHHPPKAPKHAPKKPH